MNTRTTWTLVTVALGLFAFIFFFERHLQVGIQPPGRLLPGLNVSEVTSVEVQPAGQVKIRAERTNDTWRLTSPLSYPAQPQRVQALLEALHALTRQRRISSEELRKHEDYTAEFGFDSPQFTLVLGSGKSGLRLLVGHKTLTGDEVFLQVVASDGIYLADASLLQLLPRTGDDWRDPSVLALKDFAFDRLTVTNGSRVMEFRRDPTNRLWRMARPLEARADSARLDRALRELADLRITRFANDDPKADLAQYGLQPAALDLALAQGTNPPVLLLSFGNSPTNDPAQRYFHRGDLLGVSLVPREPVQLWETNYVPFRDPLLMSLAEGSVDRGEVRGDGAFTLEESSNQVWRVTAPESFPADPALVRMFLGLLNGLRIAEFTKNVVEQKDLLNFGLNPPVRQYFLSVTATNVANGARTAVQLDIGALSDDREKVFVRRGDEPLIVYAIKRTDFDNLPRDGWQLREQRIWRFTTNEVARILSSHSGKTNEFIRGAAGNWVLGPATTGATNNFNPLAMDYTVDSLGQLHTGWTNRAGEIHPGWVDRGAENRGRYGITNDCLRIEIELRRPDAPQQLSVELGPLTPAQNSYYAATTLDGPMWIFEFPWGTYQQVLVYLDPTAKEP